MAELLTGAAALIMLSALVGLVRVLRGPTRADRLLAAQLLSTAGIGALLLLAAAGAPALIDVALVLALVGASIRGAAAEARAGPVGSAPEAILIALDLWVEEEKGDEGE
jgi:multicomponent Na+:H+ antiporter subunit F